MAKAKGKRVKSLFDKVNEVDPNFAEEVYTLTKQQLEDRLVLMAKHDTEIEEAKKQDPELPRIREELKTANETYSGPLKNNRLRRNLIIEVLGTRGETPKA